MLKNLICVSILISTSLTFAQITGGTAGTGTNPVNIQNTTPDNNWHAVADLDGDGLADVVVADKYDDEVKIHLALDQDTFAEGDSFALTNPLEVALGHIDNDGYIDLAVFTSDNTVHIYLHDGVDGFTAYTSVSVASGAEELIVSDLDDDGYSEIFMNTNQANTLVQITDINDGFVASQETYVTTTTTAAASSGSGCGDEPDCDPDAGSGIQECMRAVDCRRDKCYWAACVLYSGLRRIAAELACAAVAITERTLCLPTQLIPKKATQVSSGTQVGGATGLH